MLEFKDYLIVGAVLAVFIIIVFVLAKKTNKRQEERIKMLSQEQLDTLKSTPYEPYNGKKNFYSCLGVLTYIKETDAKKVPIDFIYWNCCTGEHEIGEINVPAEFLKSKGLKVGDYIRPVFKFKNGIIESLKLIIEN